LHAVRGWQRVKLDDIRVRCWPARRDRKCGKICHRGLHLGRPTIKEAHHRWQADFAKIGRSIIENEVSLSVYLSTTAKKGDKVASEVATVPGHNNLKRHSTETTFMSNTNNIVILVARVLLSFMFILAGFGKLTD